MCVELTRNLVSVGFKGMVVRGRGSLPGVPLWAKSVPVGF